MRMRTCLHDHEHCCAASLPSTQYAVLLNTQDARTATVLRYLGSSVGGQRGRITSLAVPCFDAASHPALRNPHVHSPSRATIFAFCSEAIQPGSSLEQAQFPIPHFQPARHVTRSCPMPRCPAAQVHRPGAALVLTGSLVYRLSTHNMQYSPTDRRFCPARLLQLASWPAARQSLAWHADMSPHASV